MHPDCIVISTKYHGPGNTRGSRFSATDSEGKRAFTLYDHSIGLRENHRRAADSMAERRGGDLTLAAWGETKEGYVFLYH